MTAQTAIMNSLAADRRHLAGDALVASDCKDIISEAFEKCAALMKDAANTARAQDILNMLEDAESEARSWQVENE
jgi:hypothetical protein